MRRSFKFLLRPTASQVAALAACLDDHRDLYNAALEHRRTAYRKAGVTVRYGEQSGELKHIRADDPGGQGRWSFSSQQATLRRLDKAFRAFFDRVKAGRTLGFPRFKGRGWFDTVEWPKDGDGCRWDSPLEHPATGAAVGLDMGVASLVATSDGEHVANPRHLAATATRLAAAQQDLARKKRGSKRRRKAVARVAALHAKVRRGRLDSAHKAAPALVRDHDVIVHEDLQIANMTRSASSCTVSAGSRGVSSPLGRKLSVTDSASRIMLADCAYVARRMSCIAAWGATRGSRTNPSRTSRRYRSATA
ncbi:RNA-guided endonuclease InsQ/TnpB family protein [Nonomuraea lactucae]|uniref:RNA-guided endonuclease InsQ/TnpB family protein n=1 Tax=Nonomuraea lactucae TaxID=2249762 RepID=UPI001F06368E|nr:transposase [Nonomuraea lactucae]